MFYEGREAKFNSLEDPKELQGTGYFGAIFAVKSPDNWKTMSFFDKNFQEIERNIQKSIINTTDINIAVDGQTDPRLTFFEPFQKYYAIINSTNRSTIQLLKEETKGNKSLPLRGSTPELYNFLDPKNINSLGFIGPRDIYFKNVILHSKLVTIDNEPNVLIICRKLPSIQGFTIPLKDFSKLYEDENFRNQYWMKQLEPNNIEICTILKPIFSWEAKGDANYPEGQIAPACAPIEVISGENKKVWLFIYNTVSYFDENKRSHGRVIGAVLLDYEDPRKVINRSPIPIIIPTEIDNCEKGRKASIFATSSYVDNKQVLRIFYSAADVNIIMASCPLLKIINYLDQFDKNGNFI